MLVPGVCVHLLDVGLAHEPACHVTLLDRFGEQARLASALGGIVLDLCTLDVVEVVVDQQLLKDSFRVVNSPENRLSILHHLLVHRKDVDSAVEVSFVFISKQIAFTFPYNVRN